MHHGSDEAVERNGSKNLLLSRPAPLVHIPAAGTATAVRAQDFYGLTSSSKTLATMRPRRMLPHRTHDFLVSAEATYAEQAIGTGSRKYSADFVRPLYRCRFRLAS